MKWLDLPLDERPQLILGRCYCTYPHVPISTKPCPYSAYEPSLDQAGHADGPDSPSVNVGDLSDLLTHPLNIL